jgi:hypothetical protein
MLIHHPDRLESEPRQGEDNFTTAHPNWEDDICKEWEDYSKKQFGTNVG